MTSPQPQPANPLVHQLALRIAQLEIDKAELTVEVHRLHALVPAQDVPAPAEPEPAAPAAPPTS